MELQNLCCTTCVSCGTRRYDGMLLSPNGEDDGGEDVVLNVGLLTRGTGTLIFA